MRVLECRRDPGLSGGFIVITEFFKGIREGDALRGAESERNWNTLDWMLAIRQEKGP